MVSHHDELFLLIPRSLLRGGFIVEQLRTAINTIYVREGQAMHHDYASKGLLMLDIDLTGLPASKQAEGSCKGYFSGKTGGADGNWHG